MSINHNIIKLRRGTAAEWSASEPQPGGEVLRLGEPGYEKDTGRLVRNNSGTQAYRNGTAFGTPQGATATENVTLNAIGRAQGAIGVVHNGPMAEVIVGRSDLSTGDRQKLEGYLAWKWGLQDSLATGHPYKLNVPIES